ncbi:MAG: hypothetical protein K2N71_07400 [Oscillospiraceae bacterium]|nr:hypothetical protein [Oscillospiraceae bacterium]
MNKDLLRISNTLEEEVLFAKAITEILKILHTASYGYTQTELDFRDIHEALWLIREISQYHSEKLLEISSDVFNAFKETDNHSSSNAPV